MYHPYCHSPSALTRYPKQKLRHQRVKRLGRSPSAQVEQSVQLKCNSLPDNNGNKVLPGTPMPWTLPLDVPVLGLP